VAVVGVERLEFEFKNEEHAELIPEGIKGFARGNKLPNDICGGMRAACNSCRSEMRENRTRDNGRDDSTATLRRGGKKL